MKWNRIYQYQTQSIKKKSVKLKMGHLKLHSQWRKIMEKSEENLCLLINPSNSPGWCSSMDWVQTVNERVTGLIPRQGTCLGCRPGPSGGYVRVNHTLTFLSLFFSLPSSENKIKSFLKKKELKLYVLT